MNAPITILIDNAHDDGCTRIELPSRWEICSECRGNGSHCQHLGSFSMQDLDEDPEFAADYMAGGYDRLCSSCAGTGKVRVVDEARTSPELLALYRQHQRDEAEYRAECAAERRMGA